MGATRRKVLWLVGGGVVVAAAGAGYVAGRTATKAVEPWSLAGGYGEVRRDALSWALLAPNPHNIQPWQAELIGDNQVALHLDPARSLPHTDPQGRQITIGMGCFIELMRLAAAQQGYAVDLELYPEGTEGSGPVALATFRPGGGAPHPLFAAAAARRSCKAPFEDRAVPEEAVATLSAHGAVVTDPAQVQALRDLAAEAWTVEMNTPAAWQESVELLRIGADEIEASPDGIHLEGPLFNLGGTLGFITREDQLSPEGSGPQQVLVDQMAIMSATPAWVVLVTDGNARIDQLQAGAAWLRLNLAATQMGLALHPVSQALQEYPEMAGPYGRIHELHAGPGQTVQMLGRLGYGPEVPATPRWRLDDKLVG